MSETVLCTEHGRNFEHPGEIRHERHLLVELRALREVGMPVEISKLENRRAAFRRGGDQFGRMDLNESIGEKTLAVERARSGLQPQNRLICGGAQIQDAVVQPDLLPD